MRAQATHAFAAGIEAQNWPRSDKPRWVRVVQADPIYAAMVHEMDRAVGVLLDKVRAQAVQFHPHGGQPDFVWLPARTMQPHGAYVW